MIPIIQQLKFVFYTFIYYINLLQRQWSESFGREDSGKNKWDTILLLILILHR